MTMRQVSVSAQILRRWYLDDRLTIEQIAQRLRCAATTVARRLREANIAVRPRGPVPGNGSDRRRIPPPPEPWLPELAYAVGLIATDGNLSRDGRHLTVVSADRDLLESLKSHPAKSLTLGPLMIPDVCFADFFRGCVDGDGSIMTYIDRYHASKNSRYVCERLYVALVSASRPFLDWVKNRRRRWLDHVVYTEK